MADADEDALPSSSSPQQDDDEAFEDAPDFRFLASFSSAVILDPHQKLPKRGEKDFETNKTKLQKNTLEASRQAMHDVLSQRRFHNPKNHVIAVYDPHTGGAWVDKAKGIMFNNIGVWRRDKPGWLQEAVDDEDAENLVGKGLWLHPEEALYMLERGTLDIHWPPAETSGANPLSGLPMSLQGAYAAFIGMAQPDKLTLEQYTVYAGLRRGGFHVVRAEANEHAAKSDKKPLTEAGKAPAMTWTSFATFWRSVLTRSPRYPVDRLKSGPLVTPGLYRNYSDIYRLLSVVPYHDPAATIRQFEQSICQAQPDVLIDGTPRLQVIYHAYKSTTPYSKRAAPPPDFNLVVFSARDSTLPSLVQLDDLMSRMPYDPPTEFHLYPKLKHGYRNVLLAVVDQGITSYTRLSDTGFAREKVYEMPAQRGGKGGRGGRGGRGRGRGRGGRGG